MPQVWIPLGPGGIDGGDRFVRSPHRIESMHLREDRLGMIRHGGQNAFAREEHPRGILAGPADSTLNQMDPGVVGGHGLRRFDGRGGLHDFASAKQRESLLHQGIRIAGKAWGRTCGQGHWSWSSFG
ncbi:MAG: hypothetical protein CMJ23_08390 [Phycisphaerae bacterium]|nr:hypothetical protein [Phycisphaerae bacterium]